MRYKRMYVSVVWLLVLCVTLAAAPGCTARSEVCRSSGTTGVQIEPAMTPVCRLDMPAFSDDLGDRGLEEAVHQSLAYYGRVADDAVFRFGSDVVTCRELRQALEHFLVILRTTSPGTERKKAIGKAYRVYVAGAYTKEVLYTGYYEPVLRGSLTPEKDYTVPLYRRPHDLVVVDLGAFRSDLQGVRIVGRYAGGQFVPYYTRHEIDRLGVLAGQGLELAWVADPVEAFFLQIQGSGRLVLPDGRSLSLGFAAHNGRPYRSIGTLLVRTGRLPKEKASRNGLIRYLRDHPEERDAILEHNERYVFFRETPEGPFGNLQVRLTPGRSLAVDQQVYPPAALVFVETEFPVVDEDGTVRAWHPVKRFMLVQDSGGAISGPQRADIFWGSGEDAGRIAGSMYREGTLYFIGSLKRP